MKPVPLSLYIHIPWCERKCPYCDFNSHQVRSDIDEAAYISCLIDDLDADISYYKNSIAERPIQTVFIGGGTPSLFSAQSYRTLFKQLRDRLEFSDGAEITLEANPGSSEVEKFAGFRDTGINRLSIGVQSFNAAHLNALGRVHNTREALHAAEFACAAGFNNFNLDLMFGLPEQSTEQALVDLRTAIELSPTHLSCYQLTIEPNTLFHHRPPVTPSDDALWEIQTALQSELSASGYQQYEVSAYAQPARRCQHNLNYWQYGDYLGIGAGAHGKVTVDGEVSRSWKIKHPASYMERSDKTGDRDRVELSQIPFEFMMNALRLSDGFSIDLFECRTGLAIDVIQPVLEQHSAKGLIELSEDHIKPTEFGHNMLNSMLEDYLND